MKKKVLILCLVVAMAATAIIGGTLAYLTATDKEVNTFTVGDVKIDLIESKYHREGNDNSGDPDIPDPTQKALGMTYVTDGHLAFTDEEIQEDAKTYKEDYLAKKSSLLPSFAAAKCPYVINTGKNAAFIRIRVLVPSSANNDFVLVDNGGVITNQWCSTSMISGEFIDGKGGGWNNAPYIDRSAITIDGVVYDQYTFVRNEALEPGKMTEWNVWNFIGIKNTADSDDIQKAIDAGAITVKDDGTITFNVLVQADAIQAAGFADATAAFAAFDAQNK